MVWGLFPADPLSAAGEDKYMIFRRGTYKVGRKGCDICVNKDKGVSRIHAEIVVDELSPSNSLQQTIRIRDCSKYGTFIDRSNGSKEKIHESSNKQCTLEDGDLVKFGTGNAAYRFCFVPLVFFVYCSESFQLNRPLYEKALSFGAHIAYIMSEECTHVLVDQLMPVKDELLDAIVAKKPVVLSTWVELIAEKVIESEIPSWSSYIPTLTVDGMPVKVADSRARATCLKGYTCLLASKNMYKLNDRLQLLLEVGGAKIIFVEEFSSNSQGLESGETNHTVCVIPGASSDKFDCFTKLGSLYRVNEVDMICAILSGHLDSSLLILPSVLVSSSCSTEETVVADSEDDVETATSVHPTPNICSSEAPKNIKKEEISMVHHPSRSEDSHGVSCMENDSCGGVMVKRKRVDESDSGNSDITYSRDLIIRDLKFPAISNSMTNSGVLNYKHFRKNLGLEILVKKCCVSSMATAFTTLGFGSMLHIQQNINDYVLYVLSNLFCRTTAGFIFHCCFTFYRDAQSGNSFNNLIPFSKYPYKSSDYGNQETLESVNEEKRRKQMEAIAEDLFNNEKGRKHGRASALHGRLAHRT